MELCIKLVIWNKSILWCTVKTSNVSYMFEYVSFQEVQGKAPGTVVVVSKIGYKLHERVIRPALVGVAKGP